MTAADMAAVPSGVAAPAPVTPTSVVVAPPGLERNEWLARRRLGVCGSDVAAVLGMDKHTSARAVYLDKIGELPDIPQPAWLEEAAEFGIAMEPVIARIWSRRTGLEVADSPGMLAHAERPWMLANIDRLVPPDSLLEIKTRSEYQLDEWEDGVPDGPALQTHWYLAVTGFQRAHVAAVIGGNKFRPYVIERDEALIEHLVDILGRFWQDVQDRRPPAVDGSEATAELLAHLYDAAEDSTTVADPTVVLPLLEERARLKDAEQQVADELRLVENRLKEIAGDHEFVSALGETAFTWKQNGQFATRKFAEAEPELAARYTRLADVVDTARLAEEHPDIYRKYRARVLRVPAAPKDTA